MESNGHKRLPKILKVNRIDKNKLCISVLFSNGEDRVLDFDRILKQDWQITKADIEYKLLSPNQFSKVKIVNHTLCWDNIEVFITGMDGKKKKNPYDIGADTLYALNTTDEKLNISIGGLLKKARLASNLSQETVAKLSGTSRTYITKLENDKLDVEIKTLKKIVEAGLDKQLTISIK